MHKVPLSPVCEDGLHCLGGHKSHTRRGVGRLYRESQARDGLENLSPPAEDLLRSELLHFLHTGWKRKKKIKQEPVRKQRGESWAQGQQRERVEGGEHITEVSEDYQERRRAKLNDDSPLRTPLGSL